MCPTEEQPATTVPSTSTRSDELSKLTESLKRYMDGGLPNSQNRQQISFSLASTFEARRSFINSVGTPHSCAAIVREYKHLQSYRGDMLLEEFSRMGPLEKNFVAKFEKLSPLIVKHAQAFKPSFVNSLQSQFAYCDASPYGVGSVLCHAIKINGKPVDRPVMMVSCTLYIAQQNYAQIDREGLALIHAVTKFHRFIYDREFKIVTDDDAIQRIFHQSLYLKAEHLAVADALSRLPSPTVVQVFNVNAIVVKSLSAFPTTADKIALETSNDSILNQVFRYVHLGWPPKDELRDKPMTNAYFKLRDQITIVNKCLLFSARVIIPSSLRADVLKTIHEGHPGILISNPIRPMFPGPKLSSSLNGKWLHNAHMPRTTASEVIEVLMSVIAIYGLPKSLMSDNGQPFDSDDYAAFCTKFNIQILHPPPYTPESNGQVVFPHPPPWALLSAMLASRHSSVSIPPKSVL
ncbi:uncharacterized protein LOC127751276 [Frankliniella occidentalis]|uniref:Uncharacterized protein LOC127751276 n=1 Tax=Frankliniella occidentalis TaxID=133901 RepID=A0A9C6X7B7_FRAOC|nr:uncharacterized protein LOC127751276 [Frankliniella occidentalis]